MTRFFSLFLLLAFPAAAWDRQKAFDYLESRQQQWAAWKPAQKAGGPCISCHTGLSYLIARRLLAEPTPRPREQELVDGVKTRLASHPPLAMLNNAGAEAVLNLLTLSLQRRDPAAPLTPADTTALQRLWDNQIASGAAKGSWTWFDHALDPVETEVSNFYGATLAQLALSAYPAQPPARIAALESFLKADLSRQPLHNRLAWLAFRPVKDAKTAAPILRQLWQAQSPDGGWTTAALGPWMPHPAAVRPADSDAYATAWAAYAARQAGVSCSEPALQKALHWLQQKQHPATGAWSTRSMNKVYPPGSIQENFLSDAATGFATAALIACPQS